MHPLVWLMLGIFKSQQQKLKCYLKKKNPFIISQWVRSASTEWLNCFLCSEPPMAEVVVQPAELLSRGSKEDSPSKLISGC